MTFFNKVVVTCFCRTFLVLSTFVFRNAQCNELTLRDVVNGLPTDTFVKVFFEGLTTYDILETRLPITLFHHRQQQFIGYNRTTAITHICKFFHTRRNIGSRTHNIFNIVIVQLDTQPPFDSLSNGYLGLLIPHDAWWSWPALECHFLGSIMQTIFLCDDVVYKIFTKNPKQILSPLGAYFVKNSVVLFDLRSSLSYWKICRAIRVGNNFVPLCLDSHSIVPGMFDSKVMTKMAVGETVQSSFLAAYNTNVLRERYYLRSINDILDIEVFLKYNASYHVSEHLKRERHIETFGFPLQTDAFVLLDDIATNFVSCYTSPVLRFEMYTKPFELELWLCIGSCVSSIAIFIYIYNRCKKYSPSFSPFFFFVSTLVEEPYSVPTALWNDSKFKTITIAWLLTSIIFTNLYTGQMITELSVPLKGEVLHTLEDIFGAYDENDLLFRTSVDDDNDFWWHNYTELHMPNDTAIMYETRKQINYSTTDAYYQQFREVEHFALLQAPKIYKDGLFEPANETQRLGNPFMYKFFTPFLTDALLADLQPKRFNPRYEFYVVKFISPKHRHYPKDPQFPLSKQGSIQHLMAAAVEKEIVDCGRSIFIAELNELRAEVLYLKRNYPERTFYVGNGTIESGEMRKLLWEYYDYGTPILAQYLRHLLQGGIRTHILQIQSHRNYLERRIGTDFIKEQKQTVAGMGMSGSIQTIFIILVAILVLASSVFLMEILYSRRRFMYRLVEQFFILLAVKVHCITLRLSKLKFFVHASQTSLLLVKSIDKVDRQFTSPRNV
jgi:hypothetical protein